VPDSLVAVRDRRDQVLARLSDAYAHDLFDVDELERRLDLAHKATTLAELDVSSFMGSVEARHRAPAEPDPARPLLRVTGSVVMGNVEVYTRLPGESQFGAWWRERRERKQLRRAERRALRAGK